jgi:hypothetical protein
MCSHDRLPANVEKQNASLSAQSDVGKFPLQMQINQEVMLS